MQVKRDTPHNTVTNTHLDYNNTFPRGCWRGTEAVAPRDLLYSSHLAAVPLAGLLVPSPPSPLALSPHPQPSFSLSPLSGLSL